MEFDQSAKQTDLIFNLVVWLRFNNCTFEFLDSQKYDLLFGSILKILDLFVQLKLKHELF